MNLNKNFFIILAFSIIFAFLFSCKSTSKTGDAPPEFVPDRGEMEELTEETEGASEGAEDEGALAESEEDASSEQELAVEPVTTETVAENEPQEIAQEPVKEEPVEVEAGEPSVEVTAVTEPPLERRPPPVPPPALLGPAEERRPTSRTTPSSQTPPSSTAQTPPSSSSQTPSALAPPSSIVQTPPLQTPPSSGTEDSSSRADSQLSSPTVSAIRDNPPFPARSGVLLAPDERIEFSRVVRATVGQTIEIPFRGNGWVFLGELKTKRGIEFVPPTRRDNEGQTFIFKAEEAGSYALKFYRQDFLRDYILNDYVQVIVDEDPLTGTARYALDRGKVTALPRWPSALDEAVIIKGGSPGGAKEQGSSTEPLAYVESAPRPARGTNTQPPVQGDAAPSRPSSSAQATPSTSAPSTSAPSAASTPPQTTTPAPQTSTPAAQSSSSQTANSEKTSGTAPGAQSEERLPLDDALIKAKEIFDGGDIAAAIAMLDRYREFYPSGSDELYWLLGQFYEAAGPSRDILLSLDYYRRLVNEYPQSRRYNDARRRIAYLERFYINIQ